MQQARGEIKTNNSPSLHLSLNCTTSNCHDDAIPGFQLLHRARRGRSNAPPHPAQALKPDITPTSQHTYPTRQATSSRTTWASSLTASWSAYTRVQLARPPHTKGPPINPSNPLTTPTTGPLRFRTSHADEGRPFRATGRATPSHRSDRIRTLHGAGGRSLAPMCATRHI